MKLVSVTLLWLCGAGALIEASSQGRRDTLQKIYSAVLSRQATRPAFQETMITSTVRNTLTLVTSVCSSKELFMDKNFEHNKALNIVKDLLRSQEDSVSLLQLAEEVRNFPGMNYHMWLKALRSVSYERNDLVGLQSPHPIALTPELFLSQEAYETAESLTKVRSESRACIPIDGSLTGTDNGVEHALWYFREDLMLGYQHGFWHQVHPWFDVNATLPMDRRGEMFYYFHRVLLMRYDAERLSVGLPRVKSLVMEDGYVIEEGYFPHLAEMEALNSFGNRNHNTSLRDANELGGYMRTISEDVQGGYLVAANGSRISVLNAEGIDLLTDNVEAAYTEINPERYLEHGVHNAGHGVIAALSENGTFGTMMGGATAIKDPVFYRWHKTVDDLFQINKLLLPPYELNGGDLSLVWKDVNVTGLEVISEGHPSSNILFTSLGNQTVEIPYTPDGFTPADNGTLEYCVKRLEHLSFQYTITAVREATAAPATATVRIFMAPRLDENGGSLSLEQQRLLFFPMDSFQITVNPGTTEILRNSTNSTLTMPWRLEDPEVDEPSEVPHCGCGWPQHLLLPRGTPEGMPFDLFVLFTESTEVAGEEDVCISARILCGVRGQKFPDPYPMGYPFDRPFSGASSDVGGHRAINSIDEFVNQVPNSGTVQVRITHLQ